MKEHKHRHLHNLGAVILGLLACLTLVAASMLAWFQQTVLVTDRFVGVVTGVTSDPVVIDRLSTQLADQIVERLTVQQRIENLLPDRLDRLAVPVAEAVEERIASTTNRLLSSEQFQSGWNTALTVLHDRLVAVLNGEAENVQIANGTLTIDLLAIVQDIVAQLQADGVIPSDLAIPDFNLVDREAFISQLGTALDVQLPPDFGQIQIANVQGLQQLSTIVQQSDAAVVGLIVVALILVGLTVVWADRRWRALFAVALGIEALIALVLIGLASARDLASDSLASPTGRPLLAAFVGDLAESLGVWLVWTAFAVGVVGILAAIFAAVVAFRRY